MKCGSWLISHREKKVSNTKSASSDINLHKLEVRETGIYGKGVFAGDDIKQGDVIKVLSGEIISFDECIQRIRRGEENQSDSLQVGLELDMDLDELSNVFNHSCNPNAGIRKVSELFALRNISAGEEIAYDYSLTVGPNIPADLWTMTCACGQRECRKIIGNALSIPAERLSEWIELDALQDWMKDELKRIKNENGIYILPEYKNIIL